MARIVTNVTETMQAPYKNLKDRLEENTTVTGEVLCIKCEMGNFKEELKNITFSEPTGPKKTIELRTYRCGVCEYDVINDNEVELMRNSLI